MTVPAALERPGDQSAGDVTPPPLPPQVSPPLPQLEGPSHASVEESAKSVVLPTPDGGRVTIENNPKVIGHGRSEVTIRRLAPEEKSSRRFWKNVILWAGCVLLLLAVCYFLAQRG